MISRAIQTEDQEDCTQVQISTSLHELLQRIASYQRYKRFQLDMSNQVEFCNNQHEVTCARTESTHFRRSPKVQHNPVKVLNDKGPLGKPLLPLEQFQRSFYQNQTSFWENRSTTNTSCLLHLPKRVSNIEQYLGINKGCKPKDLLTRITQLEMKLLAIEGRSYEYNHVMVGNKSLPQT